MTMSTIHQLLVLHGLAVKKAGDAASIAAVLGVDQNDVREGLDEAVAAGRAIGARGAFMPTPAGREWLALQYPVACADLRTDERFLNAYERFELLNKEILHLFTRWQTVTIGGATVANDHVDEDYDNRLIDELGDIHERTEPIIDGFTEVRDRFGAYGRRLAEAYDRVLAGDHEWFSGAKLDSYHTVWFELHEDLLRLLGRTRQES